MRALDRILKGRGGSQLLPLVALIRGMFRNGEQGVWYDPSDLPTLFQDSAGTTPVTAVEQPVGLMLDKSKGLVLGPELVTNGTGSSLTGWTAVGTSTWTIESNRFKATVTGTPSTSGGQRQDITVVAGKSYKVSVDVDITAIGTGRAQLIVYDGAAFTPEILNVQKTAVGSYAISGYVRPTGTTIRVYLVVAADSSTTTTAYFDNVSVKLADGNHAFQSTSASRPVLSARVNLLTKTEQFDDAYWTKIGLNPFGSGSIANAVVAPNGTTTADFICEDTTTGEHGVQVPAGSTFWGTVVSGALYRVSLSVKPSTRNKIRLRFNAYNGTGDAAVSFDLTGAGAVIQSVNATSPTITLGNNGFYVLSFVMAANSALGILTYSMLNASASASYTGDGVSGLYVWGGDVRFSNDGVGIPAYQRVNTSTDYDTAGFPLYLKTDGVDDWMQTNSINFTSTDKMTVWVGVRKLSDAAVGVIAELSNSAGGGTNGTFVLHSQNSPVGYRYAAGSGPSGTAFATDDASVFTAPISNVITGISNFAGVTLADEIAVQVNGVVPTQNISGTVSNGTYGNYPLYLFRRGGGSLPFNGRMYGLIVRGAQSTGTQISNGEKYINSKTKAF